LSLKSPIKDEEMIIVGDRVFTDVVMANRMRAGSKGLGPLAIWTTGVWQREAVVMRWLEKRLVDVVKWGVHRN